MKIIRYLERVEVSLKLNNLIARLLTLSSTIRASELKTPLDEIDKLLSDYERQLDAIQKSKRYIVPAVQTPSD